MNDYYCPKCRYPARAMEEPSRFLCMVCRKVWHIEDVLADAVRAALKEGPEAVQELVEKGPQEKPRTFTNRHEAAKFIEWYEQAEHVTNWDKERAKEAAEFCRKVDAGEKRQPQCTDDDDCPIHPPEEP